MIGLQILVVALSVAIIITNRSMRRLHSRFAEIERELADRKGQ